MLLSVLPACAAYPADRLLFFVGLGGAGLLAQFIAAALKPEGMLRMRAWWRLPARGLCVILIFVHLVMAPRALARTAGTFERYGRALDRAAASLPSDATARFQTVVLVNTPTYATFAFGALTRLVQDDPYLSRTLVLGSSGNAVEIGRPDQRTLTVRPAGGYFSSPGFSEPGDELKQVLFDQGRAFTTLDWLYHDGSPMAAGQQIDLMGVTVEITEVTQDGRPAEAAFHFLIDPQTPAFRWMCWKNGAYVPFALPAVGEKVTLPAPSITY
jgi:hypothetical protein